MRSPAMMESRSGKKWRYPTARSVPQNIAINGPSASAIAIMIGYTKEGCVTANVCIVESMFKEMVSVKYDAAKHLSDVIYYSRQTEMQNNIQEKTRGTCPFGSTLSQKASFNWLSPGFSRILGISRVTAASSPIHFELF